VRPEGIVVKMVHLRVGLHEADVGETFGPAALASQRKHRG